MLTSIVQLNQSAELEGILDRIRLLQEAHLKANAEKDELLKTLERESALLEDQIRQRDDELKQSIRELVAGKMTAPNAQCALTYSCLVEFEAERAREEAKNAKEGNPQAQNMIHPSSHRLADSLSNQLLALHRNADELDMQLAEREDDIALLTEQNTLLKDQITLLTAENRQLKVDKVTGKGNA